MHCGGRSAAQQRQFCERMARLGGIQRARAEHHQPAREGQNADRRPSKVLHGDDAQRPFQPLSRIVTRRGGFSWSFRDAVATGLDAEPPLLRFLAADCHRGENRYLAPPRLSTRTPADGLSLSIHVCRNIALMLAAFEPTRQIDMLRGLATVMEQAGDSRRAFGGVASILIVAALLALFFGFRSYMPVL